jgi:hypothetical protein
LCFARAGCDFAISRFLFSGGAAGRPPPRGVCVAFFGARFFAPGAGVFFSVAGAPLARFVFVLACGGGARFFCGWAGSRFSGWFFSGVRFRAPRRRPCAFLVLLRCGPFLVGFGRPVVGLVPSVFWVVFWVFLVRGLGDFDRIFFDTFFDVFRYFSIFIDISPLPVFKARFSRGFKGARGGRVLGIFLDIFRYYIDIYRYFPAAIFKARF